MNTNTLPRDERGFTLIEMIISILIYGIVLAIGIGFVSTQNRMFQRGLDRMTSLQNLRYALQSLETDIPTMGTNVPTPQPTLVYADTSLIAFTADYASNIANDVFASYIDLGAPNGQVTVPNPTIALPNTGVSWPDTLYLSNVGSRSPAELIFFWFQTDATTTRADDFVLFRQINDGTAEPVARNILKAANGDPFFSYLRRQDFVSAAATLIPVPTASLPVRHTSRFHRVPADTGASALADSIRAVRISFRSTNGLSGTNERIVAAARTIDMPNAGFTLMQTCGDSPIFGAAVTATLVNLGGGVYEVGLAWTSATDETAGERDVARYVIYRQTAPITTNWGDPLASIPAGLANYTYTDPAVVSGETYQYAIAAQDCTPMLSTLVQSISVTVP